MGHAVRQLQIGAAVLLLLATAPSLFAQQTPFAPESPVARAVRDLVSAAGTTHDARLAAGVRRFYVARENAPAWTTANEWTGTARTLQRAFEAAPAEGLDAGAYAMPVIDSGMPLAIARADVQLSFVALRFAQDLGWGLTTPGEVHRDNAYAPRRFPAESLLTAWSQAPDAGRALLAVAPGSPGYMRLRTALARLRDIERAGGWTRIAGGSTLRRGASEPRVQQLRAILRERDDFQTHAPDHQIFDDSLAAALARFQERHGLTADSILGAATVAAINVPVAQRIRQVVLGMERIRWLPPIDGGRWITVNLADYRAFVLENGETVFSTRVVIGATNHKTPMFTDTLTNIVLNPAWNVPPSIVAAEILPKLRRDPGYLARNHMVRIGRDIQQVPGPWNALGQVAFMFPNRFNVYMHDTPAKELFDSPDRAHSHGCIRVQRPHDLASLLLAREGWTRARIDSVIATGRRTVVPLEQPVPVRITYATAFVSNDGTLQFRPDVYGRDALLDRALSRR